MKKILGLTIAALLVMAMVGGGTWAYFSDTETSTGNTFTAGTLNLVNVISGTGAKSTVTEQVDGLNDWVVVANLAPGDSGTITWTLSNSGTLDGYLTITSSVVTTDNGVTEPETNATTTNDVGSDGDLDEYVGVWLTQKIGSAAATDLLGASGQLVPLEGLEAALDGVADQIMQETGTDGDTIIYVLTWELEADVGTAGINGYFEAGGDDVDIDDNVLQSDDATLDITFQLDQTP